MPRKPKKQRSRYGEYCEERDGILYGVVRKPIGGGKYQIKRKRVNSRLEARQWALAELDRIKHGVRGSLDTLGDLAAWYKTHYLHAPVLERGLKVEGVKDYEKQRAKLDRIVAFFGASKSLQFFSDTDLRSYARHRREKDSVATATINRDFALMRAMFNKGRESNPAIKSLKFPINTAAEVERDRVMTFDEEKRLLKVCGRFEHREFKRKDTGTVVKTDKHETKREHLKAIVIVAVDTAMRSGEIFSLTWTDVDFENEVIFIRSHNSKTQKSRKVGMTPRVKKELQAIQKPKGLVFGLKSARRSFATACVRAKIKDLHFHDLRHTGTTRMIRAGVPIAEVMKITGHTQMRTFMRYLNLVDETVQNAAKRLAAYQP